MGSLDNRRTWVYVCTIICAHFIHKTTVPISDLVTVSKGLTFGVGNLDFGRTILVRPIKTPFPESRQPPISRNGFRGSSRSWEPGPQPVPWLHRNWNTQNLYFLLFVRCHWPKGCLMDGEVMSIPWILVLYKKRKRIAEAVPFLLLVTHPPTPTPFC